MIDQIFKCDVCGAVRGPSNHWLVVTEDSEGCWFLPWSEDEATASEAKHICGAVCSHKVLDRYLESLRNGESNG